MVFKEGTLIILILLSSLWALFIMPNGAVRSFFCAKGGQRAMGVLCESTEYGIRPFSPCRLGPNAKPLTHCHQAEYSLASIPLQQTDLGFHHVKEIPLLFPSFLASSSSPSMYFYRCICLTRAAS